MKDKDNSVIFLKDWLFLITPMSAENQIVFWELFTNYEYGKEQECNNPFVAPTWNFVKKQLDNMREGYKEKVVNRNRVNGSKGGRPPKAIKTQSENTKPKETEGNPKNPVGLIKTQKTPNVNINVNENINENVNDILLKKESKEENITKEFLEDDYSKPLNLESKEKEKISAKKEKEKYFNRADFKKKLLQLGVLEKHADDWIEARKKKRASFTESVIDAVIRECEKHNYPFPEAIRHCAEGSWQGFKYSWVLNLNNNEKSDNFNTNNGAGSKARNSNGSFKTSGKVSARTLLARRISQNSTPDSESGNFTIDVEAVD